MVRASAPRNCGHHCPWQVGSVKSGWKVTSHVPTLMGLGLGLRLGSGLGLGLGLRLGIGLVVGLGLVGLPRGHLVLTPEHVAPLVHQAVLLGKPARGQG